MSKPPEFLAVGHVTKDLLPCGGYTIGGTVTYAALTARALGLSVAVLTSAPLDMNLAEALPGIGLQVTPSAAATTFENIYVGTRRRQYVHDVANSLSVSALPSLWRNSSVVLLAPIAGELGLDWLGATPMAITGVTPQGWMRQWNQEGLVSSAPWQEAAQILPSVDVLVYSEDDVGRDEATMREYARMTRIAVVTRGRNGARVYYNGEMRDLPAFRAREVDPTGAGDVFAAAFLVRLRETGDAWLSAAFANCTASFAVEGAGTSAIPSRAQVEERLRSGMCYDGRAGPAVMSS